MSALVSMPAGRIAGDARPPGDKSISHRALIMGALSVGETVVNGLLEGADVLATAAALRALGAPVERLDDGSWRIDGRGVGGLDEPGEVLDLGNSGTGVRLLMGVAASHPFTTVFTGDRSLAARPMKRVTEPLRRMGATIEARAGGRLPITIHGPDDVIPIEYESPVASAQVKSAVLLAGLNAMGATTVIEPAPSRDHTERLLAYLGAEVATEERGTARAVTVRGYPEIMAKPITVPADPSSAAFPIVAALIVPGSELVLRDVCVNPGRTGLFDTLRAMGASIAFESERDLNGEPVADIRAAAGTLTGVHVPADRAPSMIDEYPVLAAAAAYAQGTSRFEGLAELRVKESDRLAAIADGLTACGVTVRSGDDWLEVDGLGDPPPGTRQNAVETRDDHRIAMAFLVLGVGAENPVTVDDGAMIETSFPDFAGFMNGLGAAIGTQMADGEGTPA